jgi:hypothetical protein
MHILQTHTHTHTLTSHSYTYYVTPVHTQLTHSNMHKLVVQLVKIPIRVTYTFMHFYSHTYTLLGQARTCYSWLTFLLPGIENTALYESARTGNFSVAVIKKLLEVAQ